jgi:hypothetical protein
LLTTSGSIPASWSSWPPPIAREDPSRAWFSVDAGLIDRLGLELVARQETAVAELIKNAYDADALRVDVTFVDCFEPAGHPHHRGRRRRHDPG